MIKCNKRYNKKDRSDLGVKRMKLFVLALLFASVIGSLQGQMSVHAKTEMQTEDEQYLEELKEAGFPLSYRKKLLALHKIYPKWKFQAVKTGLKWDEVLKEESVNGRNLVPISADDGMKSTSKGAYDWATNQWTIFDSSSWVAAHPDYIAYMMDPRNFLTVEDIFQFESMGYSTSQKKSVVQSILKGTFMEKDVKDVDGKVLNYADAFMTIAKQSKVSPYLLATRVRQEQGTGNSELISGKNKEYKNVYNYFNFGAYGKTKEEVIRNGLKYAKAQGWTTRYKSILGGAKLLGSNYIAKGQNTLYFQKFNVVYLAELYKHQYMANVNAALSEGRNVAKGYANKNQAFVFRIPVYKSMPSSPVKFERKGNPNNYIKEISMGVEEFDNAFDRKTQQYVITVPVEVEQVEISAKPVCYKSVITGTGVKTLVEGENKFSIKCKSEKGVTRTYKVTIIRQNKTENR